MSKYRCYVYLSIILSLLCVNTYVFAAMIHVPADQPNIQSGIDAANDGDTVLVADGIYKGKGNVNIDFKGKQITVKSLNGAKAAIIDCERIAETRGFTFHNKETNDSILDGFTIRNGLHEKGGGIYCDFASPTIKNCVITENQAGDPADYSGYGGGIYFYNSSAIIEKCMITNNLVGSRFGGGGVYLTGEWVGQNDISKPNFINCTISENTGTGISSRWRVVVAIRGCTVSKNSLRGVVCSEFSPGINLITNSHIEQNRDGGVEVSGSTNLKITESIIRQNTAKSGAGIACSRTSTIDVSECIIAENTATAWGGGFDIESWSGKATITHCTITQNTSGKMGGGIYFSSTPSPRTTLTLTNSIVWGNKSDGAFAELALGGNKIVIRSCDIGGGLKGIGREVDEDRLIYQDNIDADPLFVNADRGDYRLKPNSPAAAMGVQSLSVREALSVTSVGKRLVKWAELKRK